MNIAIIGYGKMGHMIEKVARQRGHRIVCVVDVDNRQDLFSEAFRSADVAIEFTAPSAAYENCKAALQQGVKVVSGSTGWMEGRQEEMKALCRNGKGTLLWSSNFSLGVAIFRAVSHYLAGIMNRYAQYDVSETETHHIHKLDAPSGTAITLAEDIVDSLDRKDGWQATDKLHGGKAYEHLLQIKSIRRGEVPGTHTISYKSAADDIVITHRAKNRTGLALGAVLAAEYVQHHKGFLTIDDLFAF